MYTVCHGCIYYSNELLSFKVLVSFFEKPCTFKYVVSNIDNQKIEFNFRILVLSKLCSHEMVDLAVTNNEIQIKLVKKQIAYEFSVLAINSSTTYFF